MQCNSDSNHILLVIEIPPINPQSPFSGTHLLGIYIINFAIFYRKISVRVKVSWKNPFSSFAFLSIGDILPIMSFLCFMQSVWLTRHFSYNWDRDFVLFRTHVLTNFSEFSVRYYICSFDLKILSAPNRGLLNDKLPIVILKEF